MVCRRIRVKAPVIHQNNVAERCCLCRHRASEQQRAGPLDGHRLSLPRKTIWDLWTNIENNLEPVDQHHLGSPEHQLGQPHHTKSMDYRHPGPPQASAETSSLGVDGSTTSASPGVATASLELRLWAKLNTEDDCGLKQVHKGTERQTNAYAPTSGPLDLAYGVDETVPTSTVIVYTRSSTTGYLFFLGEGAHQHRGQDERIDCVINSGSEVASACTASGSITWASTTGGSIYITGSLVFLRL